MIQLIFGVIRHARHGLTEPCMIFYDSVEVPNNQRISCLDSSLGSVPACDAGDPGSIPGGGKLNVCLQGALLEDRDDPVQVSL
jgi:hypothetical protein